MFLRDLPDTTDNRRAQCGVAAFRRHQPEHLAQPVDVVFGTRLRVRLRQEQGPMVAKHRKAVRIKPPDYLLPAGLMAR